MPAQVQINSIEASGQATFVSGFIVLSGNYPSGGDPLDFTVATADPSFIGMLPAIEGSVLLNVDVWSMGGAAIGAGNSVNYNPVCTKTGNPATISPKTGCKLKCGALAASPTTEHAAAGYESQYTGDLIAFMAVFTKMI